MERISEFIKNKAYFGGYPTQEQVNTYEDIGFRYFVDLTRVGEKHITPYTTKYNYIHYPISDHRVPSDWKSFAKLIIKLSNIIRSLQTWEKMYIHCKGGHGRSGIVVACVLCYLYKITPSEAISKTTKYHNRRKGMKKKWRQMGSPQTWSQKHFVTKFFEPLYVYNNNTTYFSSGFSNDAPLDVEIPGLGRFQTAQEVYNSFKEQTVINNKNYQDNDETVEEEDIWDCIKEDAMYTVLSHKFEQHTDLSDKLLDTGLRPVTVRSSDPYWGRQNNSGMNILGKMITKLREDIYMEENA
jgi:predicted NAD-dependent protein-ADP-ribosyltransferase YbiA (DUF1768 family)